MKCIEFQAVLNDYVDRELSAAETARIEAHLAHCAECRTHVESLRSLLMSAASLPKEKTPERNLWPEIRLEIGRVVPNAPLSADSPAPSGALGQRALPSSRSVLHWLLPLAAAASIMTLATLSPRDDFPPDGRASRWTVASLAGAPRIGREALSGEAQLRIGQWIETDANSRAKLAESSIGEVSVEPNSQLRLKAADATDHRLELKRGTMSAFIWAPPRLFFVDTPAARAIDLGCAYTMTVADNGDGELHVTLGYVALEHDGREALIPAHAKCATRRGFGPGTPFDEDAPEPLQAALRRFDFERGAATSALATILELARPDDGVTLWHLLARTKGEQRAAVFDKLAQSHRPPDGVTREGILAGNAAMREAWGKAMGIGTL
jgi:hypothetical protein